MLDEVAVTHGARASERASGRADVRDDLKPGYPTLVSHRCRLLASGRRGRRDARRPRGATSRRVGLSGSRLLSLSLFLSVSRGLSSSRSTLSRVAPKRASSFLHLRNLLCHYHLHHYYVHRYLRQHTLPPLPFRRLSFPFSLRAFFLCLPFTTDPRPRRPRSRIDRGTERSHARARARGTHTRARVDRVCPRVREPSAGVESVGRGCETGRYRRKARKRVAHGLATCSGLFLVFFLIYSPCFYEGPVRR